MRISGSEIERVEACIPSKLYPQALRGATFHQTKGTVFHEYLYNVREHGAEQALQLAPEEWRERLALIDVSTLPASSPDSYAAEVAFAYDPVADTARELGRGLGRDEAYALATPAERAVGTADVVGVTPDEVVILDYKSGWHDYGPVERIAQLAFYALAACRAYGRDQALVGIIRVKDDGDSYWATARLDAFAIEEMAFRVRELVEKVDAAKASGAVPDPVEGDHCRWCPSFNFCPAKARLVNATAQLEDLIQPLTPETVALALGRIDLVKGVIKRVEVLLEDFARTTPVPLPDGTIYGPVDRPKMEFDALKAEAVLTERYGEGFAMTAVEVSKDVTKKSIDRAVRVLQQQDKRLKLGETNRLVLHELLEAKAARTRITHPIVVHKPGQTSKGVMPADPDGLPHPGEQVERVAG